MIYIIFIHKIPFNFPLTTSTSIRPNEYIEQAPYCEVQGTDEHRKNCSCDGAMPELSAQLVASGYSHPFRRPSSVLTNSIYENFSSANAFL